jgi:hypothetical protein
MPSKGKMEAQAAHSETITPCTSIHFMLSKMHCKESKTPTQPPILFYLEYLNATVSSPRMMIPGGRRTSRDSLWDTLLAT